MVISTHRRIWMTLKDEGSMLSKEVKGPILFHQNLSSLSGSTSILFSIALSRNNGKRLMSVVIAYMHEISPLCT